MKLDVEEIGYSIVKCIKLLKATDDIEINFTKMTSGVEKEIIKRAEQLKRRVEKDKDKVLGEFLTIKQHRKK